MIVDGAALICLEEHVAAQVGGAATGNDRIVSNQVRSGKER
jgi:hypothetical protein